MARANREDGCCVERAVVDDDYAALGADAAEASVESVGPIAHGHDHGDVKASVRAVRRSRMREAGIDETSCETARGLGRVCALSQRRNGGPAGRRHSESPYGAAPDQYPAL
jgi:hypothetical protein